MSHDFVYADYPMNFIMIFKNKIQKKKYIKRSLHMTDKKMDEKVGSSNHPTLHIYHCEQKSLKDKFDCVNTPL
jgi:hypothetical protein